MKEASVSTVLTMLMPTWDHREVQRIEYLPGGYTNRNYRVEIRDCAYALRIVQVRSPRPFEGRYLDLDIAPDVVAHDVKRGHLLTRWIEGRILADAPPGPGEAGMFLADLHMQIPGGLNRYDFTREVAAMFRQARHVDAAVRACFEQTAWRPLTWRGCHNDLNPWNVIRTDEGERDARFRTLDWESAGDNDPLFDLVGLCLGLGWGLREAIECHVAYRRRWPGIVASELRLRDTFRAYLVREYAWAVAQLAAGNDRDEVRNQVGASREALAEWC